MILVRIVKSIFVGMGWVRVNCNVGPFKSPIEFQVVFAPTTYHALLGRPQIHKYQAVPSTYHQCIKGGIKGKEVRVPAVSTPFERSEIHFADAIHYSEFAKDGELSLKEVPGSATTSLGGLNEGRCREVQRESRVENLMKRDEAEPSERAQKKVKTDGEEQCIKVTLPDGTTFYSLQQLQNEASGDGL